MLQFGVFKIVLLNILSQCGNWDGMPFPNKFMKVTKHFMARDVICHINEIFLLRNLYAVYSSGE